ncbi:TSC22 domain family protein 1-like [Tachysurus vachellii]|uniref:TSC22 domain family protein 1-like n=1 Tax=Tachysurus vachellii TaxID=175792 RepID=UPI00296B0A64|nr:TSC22 domain family protein 1-like [Tachysurus vachellii]
MNSSPVHSPTAYGSVPNYKRSRSCVPSVNIDSRIAKAMDLVKTHMLSAVREEVEPLREKIKNLTERNIELERENHLLRSLAKYQTALSSGQITNHQTALTSGQIKKYPTVLTSGQTANQQTIPNSGQVTNHQTALTSNHHCNPHDINLPEPPENLIFRSVDYPVGSNSGCFSVNTQPYLNLAIKRDVRCV